MSRRGAVSLPELTHSWWSFSEPLETKRTMHHNKSFTVLEEHISLAYLCFQKEGIGASISAVWSMEVATVLVNLFPSQPPVDHPRFMSFLIKARKAQYNQPLIVRVAHGIRNHSCASSLRRKGLISESCLPLSLDSLDNVGFCHHMSLPRRVYCPESHIPCYDYS